MKTAWFEPAGFEQNYAAGGKLDRGIKSLLLKRIIDLSGILKKDLEQ